MPVPVTDSTLSAPPDAAWLWQPRDVERTNVYGFLRQCGLSTREEFLRWSVEHLTEFWAATERALNIEWAHPYTQVLDESRGIEWAQWFVDGQLNITQNCVHRWADSSREAIVWEGEDGSVRTLRFDELSRLTHQTAQALLSLGLQRGDRVALCLPMIPEVAAVFYAVLQLGLIVVPIFSGYGPGAIATRLQDSGARVLITADGLRRRSKLIALKAKTDQALAGSAIEHVVVIRYQGNTVAWQHSRDRWWHELIPNQATAAPVIPLPSEATALLLYTSGTTGQPKGTVHTHAGTLVQTGKEIFLAFDHQPDDRFWWLSDIGWMMGPWMLIGNHQFGGTVFLYDGAPDFPGPQRLWDMIARHRITTFGVSPTAIRLLMRQPQASLDLPTLRLLGSTGEPWDDTSYRWFFSHVGGSRCPIINISGGTEIVGCFLLPLPLQPLKSCTLGGPAPGMATDVFDEQGHPVRGRTGHLVCTRPAPSMTRGIWGDPDRYLRTYWSHFPGVWSHGDWASVDADGLWYLHGRADESMNVAGRKVGPAEVETALTQHPAVSEAAVIGVPDDLTGEAIVAFVVVRPDHQPDAAAYTQQIVQELGPTFRPRAVHSVTELPKTQSGKVVRRLIRTAYLGEPLGDTSTVENPASLEQFRCVQ